MAPIWHWTAPPAASLLYLLRNVQRSGQAPKSVAKATTRCAQRFSLDVQALQAPCRLDDPIWWEAIRRVATGSASVATALRSVVQRPGSIELPAKELGPWIDRLDGLFADRTETLGEELRLRIGPLRDMWDSGGRGALVRLQGRIPTVARAWTFLVLVPIQGGLAVPLAPGVVAVEGVLTNAAATLPEVARLLFAVARAGCTLAESSSPPTEFVRRAAAVGAEPESLWPLLVSPEAAAAVQWVSLSAETLTRAVQSWVGRPAAGPSPSPETAVEKAARWIDWLGENPAP